MLFKSLRERILVFFSLLILGVQLVSFAVVNQAGKDAVTAQQTLDAEKRQRIFSSLASAELRKMDAVLQATSRAYSRMPAAADARTMLRTMSHTLTVGVPESGSEPNVIAALGGEHLITELFTGDDGQLVTVLAERGDLLQKLSGLRNVSSGAERRDIAGSPTGGSTGSPQHYFFTHNSSYFLASTLRVGQGTGAHWLSIAQDIEYGLGVSLGQALGARLEIAEYDKLSEYNQLAGGNWQLLDMQNMPFNVTQGLQFWLSRDKSALAEQFEQQKIILMLLIAVGLLLTLLGGYALADELTRPLKALTKAAKNIKAGEYTYPIEIYQRDEIGQLAGTIAHMCDRVAEREEKIMKLAYADSLTGLPNRALFDDRLNQAVSTGARTGASFSVLLMDMDRFKYINDVLGHESGDFVLKQVASRLSSVLRESDTVARLGGDEFALLLTGGNDYQLMSAINKILEVFEEPVNLNNQPLDIACSLGIAKYPEHGEDASLLLRRADMAMYAAKRLNSGYAFYDPDCDQHQQEHLSLLGDIKRAVENDELQLFFQPKVSFADEANLSVETLLRWQHPRRGLIPPAEFIPFAEHTGAIRLITRWLIKHALKQSGEWHRQGLQIQMSLNISARDLVDPDFPEMVSRELSENRVPPAMLCMEITESALMQDPAKAKRTLEVLHSMGIKMSIDDYGTGYSSLAYVKNLPVNELKIDREFVKNMIHNREDSAIVKSTIELGHNLGMRVVAEGIEQDQEMELLKSFGCDQGQGYLISHALTAVDLEQWLHEKRLNNAGLDDSEQDGEHDIEAQADKTDLHPFQSGKSA